MNISSPTTYLLPWVSQVDHLGHIIHESGSQDVDCRKAKGSYIGSISAYSLQNDFGSNISNISDKFSLDILNSPPRAIFEEYGPVTNQEDNIECLQHLLL